MSSLKARIHSGISVLLLAATSVVTIATSKHDPNRAASLSLQATGTRSYYVASNCPGAVPQERITVQDGRLTEPHYRQFVEFGLPMTVLNVDLHPRIQGMVRGYQMDCTYSSYGMQDGRSLDVYSCYENTRPICQVSFEQATSEQANFE